MAVLKKIRASTLMETMVGTVLTVVIFMLSSLVMNSLFSSQIRANSQPIQTHLNELEYQLINGKVNLPYFEEWEMWDIIIDEIPREGIVIIEAKEKEHAGKRTIKRKSHYVNPHQEDKSFNNK